MPKKVNKKKHDFIKIMFTIGIVGILIIIISAVLVFYVTTKDNPKNNKTKNPDTITKQEDKKVDSEDKEIKRLIGIIKTMNGNGSKSINVVDTDTDQVIKLSIDDTVAIKDKFGKQMTFNQVKVGSMVNVKYTVPDNKIESLRMSGETWEKLEVDSVKIDKANKTIIVNNDKYNYTDNILALYKGEKFDLSELNDADVLTLRGYKEKVCYVELIKGHGKLTIKDYDAFVDGTLDIDRDKTYVIEENMKEITLTEGTHKIVAEKENYEPFIEEVNIERGKVKEISFGSIQYKKGTVEFRTNIENNEDIQLFINDELKEDINEPIILEYGKYNIIVKHKNYDDFKGELVVDKDYSKYSVEMKKKPKYINIDTNPSEVEVYIDDSFIGYSPVAAPIEPGEHDVLLVKEGYISKKHKIKIMDDDEDAYYNFPSLEYNRKNNNANDTSNNSNTNDGLDDLKFDNNNNNNNDNSNNNANNQDDDLNVDGVLTPSDDVYDE